MSSQLYVIFFYTASLLVYAKSSNKAQASLQPGHDCISSLVCSKPLFSALS